MMVGSNYKVCSCRAIQTRF